MNKFPGGKQNIMFVHIVDGEVRPDLNNLKTQFVYERDGKFVCYYNGNLKEVTQNGNEWKCEVRFKRVRMEPFTAILNRLYN